jgi:hypothetical protein
VNKKVAVSSAKFLHERDDAYFELTEAADKNILVVSLKRNKDHITTSFTKADLQFLFEFLKLRGIE